MPRYDYTCDKCAEFAAWRPMSEAREPAVCPTCGDLAPRAVSAPSIATMDLSRRNARGTEERSADQPGVVRRDSVPHLVDRDRREQQTPRRFQHAHGPYPWTVGH